MHCANSRHHMKLTGKPRTAKKKRHTPRTVGVRGRTVGNMIFFVPRITLPSLFTSIGNKGVAGLFTNLVSFLLGSLFSAPNTHEVLCRRTVTRLQM